MTVRVRDSVTEWWTCQRRSAQITKRAGRTGLHIIKFMAVSGASVLVMVLLSMSYRQDGHPPCPNTQSSVRHIDGSCGNI